MVEASQRVSPAVSSSIFLSYAHADNEPETDRKGEVGWVDHFQARLLKQIRRRGRLDAGFWRDVAEIPGAIRFTKPILDGLAKCHVLLPIVSPTYIQRPWCKDELATFAARVATDPDVECRIVPVFKLPVKEGDLPQSLHGRRGYHFYRHHEIADRIVEFFRRGDEVDHERYSETLDEVAEYICSVLPKSTPFVPIANPAADGDTVSLFVAAPAADMFVAYDRITDELKSRGFRVLTDPAIDLPLDPPEFEAAVMDALGQVQLAVHLLGHETGARVGGTRLVDAQLALTFSQVVPRVIWAPELLFDDPTQPEATERARGREPLAVLKNFGDFRDGDSVSGDPLEAFLQDLVRRCENLRPIASRQERRAGGAGARVYVMGALEDMLLVDDVTATLIDAHRLRANPCTFEGSPDDVRRLHEEEMRESDAVLYCWGNATDTWVRSYVREARNAWRFGRQEPYRATALLRGPPLHGRKLKFRTADVSLELSPTETVTRDTLEPFVSAIR